MTQVKTLLKETPFDPAFLPGARNAIVSCLRIQPNEKVTLITDYACLEIGAALAAEMERLGLNYHAFTLEDLAPRPLADMPGEILADMETSDVSIYAVKAQPNELRTRMQMTDVVNRRKMRHAHMVNIDPRIMVEGMRADFEEVDRISTRVWQMTSAAQEIRATTPAGTDSVGRICHWNEHCDPGRNRQYSAGREDSRRSHRIRQSLRCAHRCGLVFLDAHRRSRPQI